MKTETYELGKIYKIWWKPTKYLYSSFGELIKITDTSLHIWEEYMDNDEYVSIQKKFIKYITLIN